MNSEIYRIAYQLHSEGKSPSVALVRAKLSMPTSLPVIVQALQQWKLNPNLGKEVNQSATSDDPLPASKIKVPDMDSIERRLARLEDKMDRILALLEQQG